ncbi:hypothetical protein SEMRO_259_G101380.1 [Seminavis robusta]|uniref:Uncharacterized protein n=1 Tax=Seminavis robusta TaxID=568900 RepID=A0A9N8DNH0_9STRA|nr:hypothetical protein SEMRO_259_G101380.1 [Seminavis robusta]|eukprot:Sro259_g101380.1 n/a (207) ;mRNA; f:48317-48937
MECYGKVMDHFGLSSDEGQQGVYRYYEGAFLHRAMHFHPQHNMEVYFPLEDNSKSGEEILCLVHNFMEEEGHDRAGQQVDYYFSKTNDDFWMSPENGKSPMGGNATNTYTPGEVLRVNIYTHWVVLSQDKHTKFELFLEHFNSQNLTYTLNWAKALPANPRLLSRVLENYPHLEEWQAFVRARDPHGVFLSYYWQKVFSMGSEISI